MRKTLQKKSHENSHHAMLNSDSKNKFLQKKQEIERYVVQYGLRRQRVEEWKGDYMEFICDTADFFRDVLGKI